MSEKNMNDIVIEFKDVTKTYKLFANDRQRLKAVFSKKAKYKKKLVSASIQALTNFYSLHISSATS